MLSSEANEIAEKDAKKTIACEHITKALQELGFGEYVPELMNVAEGWKVGQVVRMPCASHEARAKSWSNQRTRSNDFATDQGEEAEQN